MSMKWHEISNDDIEAHLGFAELFIEWCENMYDRGIYCSFVERLNLIRDEMNDTHLNIGVIGDASVGKSTFINALLRCNLLKTHNMLGTTLAATVIEYSYDYRLLVTMFNGDKQSWIYDSLDELRKVVEGFTTDTRKTRDIKTVNIGFPSSTLRDYNFRIIDTPGLDKYERQGDTDTKVTSQVIKDMIDMSIILIDPKHQLPKSLSGFLKRTKGVLEQCLFLVSQWDRFPDEEEREEVMEFINERIEDLLGIESALVLPYSSTNIINASLNLNASPELVKISLESEKRILAFASECRAVAQTKKLIYLIDDMFGEFAKFAPYLKSIPAFKW